MNARERHLSFAFVRPKKQEERLKKRPPSPLDSEAVLHEAAIRMEAVAVGCAKARGAALRHLDGVDEFCLPHSAGLQSKGPGLRPYLRHDHSLLSDFCWGHPLISFRSIAEHASQVSRSQNYSESPRILHSATDWQSPFPNGPNRAFAQTYLRSFVQVGTKKSPDFLYFFCSSSGFHDSYPFSRTQ